MAFRGRITNRRDAYEAVLTKRREEEMANQQKWNEASRYFNSSTTRAYKEKRWTSSNAVDRSLQAFQSQNENKEYGVILERRRTALREMLTAEASRYRALMDAIDISSVKEDIFIPSTALKKSRDEERARKARNVLQGHLYQDNNDLYDRPSVCDSKSDMGSLDTRKSDMKPPHVTSGAGDTSEAEVHIDLQRQERTQQAKHRQQLEEEAHLAEMERQLLELQLREDEAKRLAAEEETILAQLSVMDKLEEEKQVVEEKYSREIYGRALLNQHSVALKRKSALVQSELETELAWLKRVFSDVPQSQIHSDHVALIRQIEYQLMNERKRELGIESMHSREVRSLWSKQEERWKAEAETRHKLLQLVLEDRRNQLTKQLAVNRQLQHDELEVREALLNNLEDIGKSKGYTSFTQQKTPSSHERHLNNEQPRLFGDGDDMADAKAEAAYAAMIRRQAERSNVPNQQVVKAVVEQPTSASYGRRHLISKP